MEEELARNLPLSDAHNSHQNLHRQNLLRTFLKIFEEINFN